MASHVEIPLGKDREKGKSPMVARSSKVGLIKVKLKRNDRFHLLGKKKRAGSHLQFTTFSLEWKALCPMSAPGQVNVLICHNSSDTPVLNLWGPASLSWGYTTVGSLGFLSAEICPYTIEGRLQGFNGTEAGVLKVSIHMDMEIPTSDLGPCELISDMPGNAILPKYLYTTYTNDVIPETNLGILRTRIDETSDVLIKNTNMEEEAAKSTALDLMITYRSKLPKILDEIDGCIMNTTAVTLLKAYLIPVGTATVVKSYRACIRNVLKEMPSVDSAYWDAILENHQVV